MRGDRVYEKLTSDPKLQKEGEQAVQRAIIHEFIERANKLKCPELQRAAMQRFADDPDPDDFRRYIDALRRMEEVDPVQRIAQELDGTDMSATNYMRLFSQLRALVPQESLADGEICRMIEQRMPEAVQRGLQNQIMLTKSLNVKMNPMQAISAAETIRLACAESLEANRGNFKRPTSSYKQQQHGKAHTLNEHGNAGKQHQHGKAGPLNEQGNAGRAKRKQEQPQEGFKQSPKKRAATEKQGIGRDDPRYLCKLHRKFGDKAHYCKDPDHCKHVKKTVNHLSASEQQGDESSGRGKKPKKSKNDHGA